MIARIYKSTGSWYKAIDEVNSTSYACRLAGKLKLDKSQLTNPIAVGDFVELVVEKDSALDQATIIKILPRDNYLARQSPKSRHQIHIIAANVDQVLLVTTFADPAFKPGFIDRFLLTTEPQNIPVIICVNKCDNHQETEHLMFDELKNLYEGIGYTFIKTSALQNIGIDDLCHIMEGKTTLISGQSGVGKSSLMNALQSDLIIKTQEISDYSGKGMHTTTFAEMYSLDFGARIIDTPGMKLLAYNNLTVMDVAHNFREFFEASSDCRFGADCTHRNEPNCEVKRKLESGEISALRYLHYNTILEEIEKQNYWERNNEY